MVGAIGLEPTTPTMSRWCSNQLSYASVESQILSDGEGHQVSVRRTATARAHEQGLVDHVDDEAVAAEEGKPARSAGKWRKGTERHVGEGTAGGGYR